jgi:hypothetical protein|tara:strand:- start:29 stop:1654 length:1626 start_codon:yes stop_codon:yes gene_type:complete
MAIKRYNAEADNTIVNAFGPGLRTRATGSNSGQADVLETYSIYGRVTTSSQELSRILIQFPMSGITSDRSAGTIPGSGSVSFYLRMYNAETSNTVPRNLKLIVQAVSQSWQEGNGVDLENYTDATRGNVGSNWMSASNTTFWTDKSNTLLAGGSFHTQSTAGTEVHTFTQEFPSGLEDLEINITPLVEHWLAETYTNYGVGVFLTSSQEAFVSGALGGTVKRVAGQPDPADTDRNIIYNPSGSTVSFYTKRFFGRGSEFFFKRPNIEARWNDSKKDDRGNFFYSSSLASAADNLNTLYLYNIVRGRLSNIPEIGTTGSIMVSLYSGSADNSEPSGSRLILYNGATALTGGYVSTGIYSCSVAITAAATPLETLYDVWHSGTIVTGHTHLTSKQFFTGSIIPEKIFGSETVSKPVYYLNITNLQSKYRSDQTARFNLYVRNKNWNPNIYTSAKVDAPTTTIESASYMVYRTLDGLEAIPHGTGSDLQTVLSHDVSGNYFDFDMNLLEPGYEYAFRFAFYDPSLSSWTEQRETFKFRVIEYEY